MLTCSSASRGGGWHSGVLTCEVITQVWRRNYLKRYGGGGGCKGKEVKKNERERARRGNPSPPECCSPSSKAGPEPRLQGAVSMSGGHVLQGHHCHHRLSLGGTWLLGVPPAPALLPAPPLRAPHAEGVQGEPLEQIISQPGIKGIKPKYCPHCFQIGSLKEENPPGSSYGQHQAPTCTG